MEKFIKWLFWLILFLIGMLTSINGMVGIIPDSMLTELGKNNREIMCSKILLFNWFNLICGTIIAIKALNKVEETFKK